MNIPEAVGSSTPDGHYSWDSNAVLSYSVKAIQELNLKLEDLATTTPAIEESTFTGRFFSSLFTRLTQWFADATNGIAKIVTQILAADRVETQELCTTKSDGTEVCASGDQLAAILTGSAAAAGTPAAVGAEAPAAVPGAAGNATSGQPIITNEDDSFTTAATTTPTASSTPMTSPPANDNQPVADGDTLQGDASSEGAAKKQPEAQEQEDNPDEEPEKTTSHPPMTGTE